jgi:CRP-like cAMP-binding protein
MKQGDKAMLRYSPKQNCLLNLLPEADYARLLPVLELVALPAELVIYEVGEKIDHIYFPIDSVISRLAILENGASAEVAITGNDGMVGVSLCMGSKYAARRTVVLSSGSGYRLKTGLLHAEFRTAGALPRLALLYTQALMTQMLQTAACNQHHTVGQRLSRWLLLILDRTPGDKLAMTQDVLAHMLGARREGVTEAALNLQRDGIINYSRGHIQILNRTELESRACECYAVVKRESDRLFRHASHTEIASSRSSSPRRHTSAHAIAA